MKVQHGTCGRSWWQSGNRTGHCSACHLTFQGATAFDRHRRDGACLDPATALDKRGVLVFTRSAGTHGFDAESGYWSLRSEPFDAVRIFGSVDHETSDR